MKGVKGIEESLEFGVILSILFSGINALWGIFFLPWGLIGIVFALFNIWNALILNQSKGIYLDGRYRDVEYKLKTAIILGMVFGWLILGMYSYKIYLALDDLIIKSKLIRNVEEITPIYASPKIPERRK